MVHADATGLRTTNTLMVGGERSLVLVCVIREKKSPESAVHLCFGVERGRGPIAGAQLPITAIFLAGLAGDGPPTRHREWPIGDTPLARD